MLETIDPALQLDAARKVSGECENRQWSLSMGCSEEGGGLTSPLWRPEDKTSPGKGHRWLKTNSHSFILGHERRVLGDEREEDQRSRQGCDFIHTFRCS